MSLAEKIAMIHGTPEDPATSQGQPGYVASIPRLRIPPLRLVDGPPGVLTKVWSTGMTAAMGLAATFSREDARRNGEVVGGAVGRADRRGRLQYGSASKSQWITPAGKRPVYVAASSRHVRFSGR